MKVRLFLNFSTIFFVSIILVFALSVIISRIELFEAIIPVDSSARETVLMLSQIAEDFLFSVGYWINRVVESSKGLISKIYQTSESLLSNERSLDFLIGLFCSLLVLGVFGISSYIFIDYENIRKRPWVEKFFLFASLIMIAALTIVFINTEIRSY